jgi:phage repressor protein C with HTH and peptisase S24 domain
MKNRLLEFLKYLGIGQTKFEEKVGLSRGLINKIGEGISSATIFKISKVYPELNPEWLISGKGGMLKENYDIKIKDHGVSDRFLAAIEMLGLTGYGLSKEIPEITPSKLSHIRKGRNEPSKPILAAFLKKYDQINPVWLYTGEGEPIKGERITVVKNNIQGSNNIQGNNINSSNIQSGNNIRNKYSHESLIKSLSEKYGTTKRDHSTIPLIPIEAIAGFPDGDVLGVKYEECEQYNIPEFIQSGVEFIIRVSGSSMYPKYSNGDLLACRKIKDILFFQWGKVYVIDSSQGAMVKRIFEDKDNVDNIILVSDNKEHYPPFAIPKNDIRSLSIVVGVIRME